MHKCFHLDVAPGNGYRFRLFSPRPLQRLRFMLDEINCLNIDTDDYEIIVVNKSVLRYELEECGELEFQVGFKGEICFDLVASQRKALTDAGWEVDYNLEIFDDTNTLAQDIDYELVYNKRIFLGK